MLKIITIVLLALVAGVLLYAATRPDTFRIQRTASIKAPPDKIFPFINDLRRFNTWNPYEKKDPALKGSYSGAASGKGAMYAFQGNKDVGKGSVEITDTAPPLRVSMQLHMIEPMEARNDIEFILEPKGDVTNVIWAMNGRCNYVAKIFRLFVNMDRMIGGDFEAGLASLKAVVEQQPAG
jgi:Polyketide cyclase / dehydrase and lipid transport